MPWWEIEYFERNTKEIKHYTSDMLLFKLLPEIEEVSNKIGHKFSTDQIQIMAGGVKVHMPSATLWIPNYEPQMVEKADRVILNRQVEVSSDGTKKIKSITIGLYSSKTGEKIVAIVSGLGVKIDHRKAAVIA